MTDIKTHSFKLAAASLLACSAMLTSGAANAALVTGNASISIDNNALAAATGGWIIDGFFDASFNSTAINAGTTGGSSSTSNMLFTVNSEVTTFSFGNPPNRSLQATSLDSNNTASGQIGLSGALRMSSTLGNLGVLAPYDFTLQKFAGTWNLVSHDLFFGTTTFLQVINASESVDNLGQLSVSGDLIFGGGVGPTTSPSPFGLTWSTFLGANPNLVVGSLNLAPAPVPVPGAVWLFGSSLLGLIGIMRRKTTIAA